MAPAPGAGLEAIGLNLPAPHPHRRGRNGIDRVRDPHHPWQPCYAHHRDPAVQDRCEKSLYTGCAAAVPASPARSLQAHNGVGQGDDTAMTEPSITIPEPQDQQASLPVPGTGYDPGVPMHIEYPRQPVPALLRAAARLYLHRTATIF